MMTKFLKFLIYTILFIYLLIAFLPKENLYYFGLQKLQSYEVVVKNEKLQDNYLAFSINNADIYFKGIDAVKIDMVEIETLLYDNSVNIANIKVDESLKKFLPSSIDSVKVKHNIVDPLFVYISLEAKEIRGEGYFDIVNRKLELTLKPSKKFVREYKTLLRQAKKQSNGEYKIEYQL